MAELSKLGRYQLRRVLGRGAMGVVYDGFDPTINRRVAVKTILKSHAIDEVVARDYSARFVREAQAAGRLNHPNIVQVYDFGEQDDIAYLVMEFIQGNELRSFFSAKQRFEIGETVRIMGELLDALDFAHDLGVVHRDVKPANVMLDSQRRVKLADFGVARVQDGAEQSQAGTMVGTPAFMSPEQISGGKIDRRTDVFSAGTILYQLLTGEQPFTGEGAWTVAKKIMQDNPARPSSIVTNLPLAFDEVVNRALAKTAAQRFASAREFAAALRGVLGGAQPAESHPGVVMPKPKPAPAAIASEAEVEFWRSIQNSSDAEEFTVYLDAFPEGTYAQLARLKIAKLKGGGPAQNGQRLEAEVEAKRKAAEQRAQLEAEEQAKRKAVEAKREAEETARKAAAEKARLEAEAKARRDAQERAKQEALEKARQDSAAKARREAEQQARVDAEVRARREAADKARRESEEKVRQAQALARLRQQEEAAARAKAAADEDSTVAFDSRKSGAQAPAAPKPSYVLPIAAGAILLLGVGVGAYLYLGRTKAPDPVAQPAAPVVAPKVEISAAEIEKIRKETEERIRREYADKSAAAQATAAKEAADKAVAEKQLAMKAVAEKAAREKAAAEKLAREKAAAEKAAVEKAAAEQAGASRVAAERLAAERAAAEKAAAEKAAAEKAAADKAAAERVAVAKPAPAPAPSAPANSAGALLQQAVALEGEKKYVDAVRAYLQAARAGSGPAAKRLGDIYVSGLPGVAPDSAESTKWHTLARARGAMK